MTQKRTDDTTNAVVLNTNVAETSGTVDKAEAVLAVATCGCHSSKTTNTTTATTTTLKNNNNRFALALHRHFNTQKGTHETHNTMYR